MRVIVCGGRDYHDKATVYAALDRLHKKKGIDFLIQGGAAGADYLAWQWCQDTGVPCGSFPAQWDQHGRKAGPIRNQQMIDDGMPDGIVAFPGGPGTDDMIQRAKRAGIRIWEPAP